MADESDSGQGFRLLGKSVSTVPCYRDSLMTGIGGGLVSGLGSFLFTSNIRKSTNLGFASFVGLTLVAWGVCRSRRPVTDEKAIKAAIKNKILTEGTEQERLIEAQTKDV